MIQVIQNDEQENETIDYYDLDWNKLNIKSNYLNSYLELNKPSNLKEMIEICNKLADDHPFVRIDLFTANSEIYFSEFTFFSDAGFIKYFPSEWEYKLGEMIIYQPKMINIYII